MCKIQKWTGIIFIISLGFVLIGDISAHAIISESHHHEDHASEKSHEKHHENESCEDCICITHILENMTDSCYSQIRIFHLSTYLNILSDHEKGSLIPVSIDHPPKA